MYCGAKIVNFTEKMGIFAQKKMKFITFDPVHHTYIQLGKTVGNAFSDGKE